MLPLVLTCQLTAFSTAQHYGTEMEQKGFKAVQNQFYACFLLRYQKLEKAGRGRSEEEEAQ